MKTKRGKRTINKSGQEIFGLSFGMIFAMILVIFFVVLAIIVIKSFLEMQNCSKIGIFAKELTEKVDNAWNSGDASSEYIGYLPSAIQYVCFADLSKDFIGKNSAFGASFKTFDNKNNFFFYPTKKSCELPGHIIKNLDISAITKTENPFCIKVQNGKVSMMIEIENGMPLVIVTR